MNEVLFFLVRLCVEDLIRMNDVPVNKAIPKIIKKI